MTTEFALAWQATLLDTRGTRICITRGKNHHTKRQKSLNVSNLGSASCHWQCVVLPVSTDRNTSAQLHNMTYALKLQDESKGLPRIQKGPGRKMHLPSRLNRGASSSYLHRLQNDSISRCESSYPISTAPAVAFSLYCPSIPHLLYTHPFPYQT